MRAVTCKVAGLSAAVARVIRSVSTSTALNEIAASLTEWTTEGSATPALLVETALLSPSAAILRMASDTALCTLDIAFAL